MKKLHVEILKAFDDLKFNLGKKTLIEFIKGNPNPTIERNNLDELNSYGCLYKYDLEIIEEIVEQLIDNGFLKNESIKGGFFVVSRTSLGTKEIFEKKFEFEIKKNLTLAAQNLSEETKITDEDKKMFEVFNFFLDKFNDEQKKAIVCQDKNILCVAGAGSGKTTVLTKRIEFLTKFKGIKQEEILAITFTKKAKEEMQHRLEKLGIVNSKIETFNSFCEKILLRKGSLIYEKEVSLAQYRDKIQIIRGAISKLGINFAVLADDYFTKKQLREKTTDDLFFIFVNDVFSIIDYYKNKEENILEFYEKEKKLSKKKIARNIYDVCMFTREEMKKRGLRDFSDQILDSLELFRKNPQEIPNFKHVLVDEFQDVNLPQIELLKLLNPENIFAVGDPRQAIYGWRGSDIRYIINFEKNFEKPQIINLKINYRSDKEIVEFFNKSIRPMKLVDLESGKENNTDNDKKNNIFIVEQANEKQEKLFVFEAIKNSKNKRNEIFVLARTNKILEGFAEYFAKNNIKFAIKSEEEYKMGEPQEDEVVLATVHSIKGMEAEEVYLVNANSLSFPNKVVDNFVFALVKDDDNFQKEEEELRLFYVALSRAKSKLVISYTGNYSKFITEDMLLNIDLKQKNKSIFDFSNLKLDKSDDIVLKNLIKNWRQEKSKEKNIPLYMVISNNAIEDLIRRKPKNKEELYYINGLGESKISQYGDEILKLISN